MSFRWRHLPQGSGLVPSHYSTEDRYGQTYIFTDRSIDKHLKRGETGVCEDNRSYLLPRMSTFIAGHQRDISGVASPPTAIPTTTACPSTGSTACAWFPCKCTLFGRWWARWLVILMRRCERSKTRHYYYYKQYHLSKSWFWLWKGWTTNIARECRQNRSDWPEPEFMHVRIMIFTFSIGKISVYEGK